MKSPRVLVTGATGFVDEAIVFRLLLDKMFTPVAAVRGETRLSGLCPVVPLDLSDELALPPLDDVRVVIHCAARVHVMNDTAIDPLAQFRKVNVDGMLGWLARLPNQA
jgi:nucleoside-diphosphate-sugar epimerase